MATKRRPKTEDELFEVPSRAELDIEDFLEEWAPQTSVVEVYRRKEDGSMPHLKRVGIEILQADLYGYLRDKFGNGKYQLQFKDSSRKIVKSLMVDVEGASPAIPSNGVPAVTGNSFHEQLIIALIASLKPTPQPPAPDMGTLLTGLGAMLQAMKPSASDPAAMLAAMAQTFQQLKPPEDNVDKALSIISKAKDIAGDGGGSGDSWPGLIKEGVTAVAQVFQQRQNGQPETYRGGRIEALRIPPGAEPTGAVMPENAGPQPAPVPKTSDQLLEEWLQTQIAFLKTKARAGKDPEFWVEYIVDNAEEPGCAAILEAMRRGATYQHLLTFDPEIGKDPILAGWFQQFYEALSAELNADMDSTGAGGNTPDPGGDAKPSTP